ncbi:hypothetical protein SAOR_16010 [Salinisphaera orenii MK-B5]|uniref:Uncharacterized protein n=1 Tax=Salinisphaera orenii MK-B5 TaxID=856730 RepID=A0A423PFA9_9GAMM|nr:hypothetical protein SAOR_16010 [Salinisphaera orenii MK-B5]
MVILSQCRDHEDVDVADRGRRGFDISRHGVGRVAGRRMRGHAVAGQRSTRLLEPLGAAPADGDMHARRRQHGGDGQTDAAAVVGDDGAPAGEMLCMRGSFCPGESAMRAARPSGLAARDERRRYAERHRARQCGP